MLGWRSALLLIGTLCVSRRRPIHENIVDPVLEGLPRRFEDAFNNAVTLRQVSPVARVASHRVQPDTNECCSLETVLKIAFLVVTLVCLAVGAAFMEGLI